MSALRTTELTPRDVLMDELMCDFQSAHELLSEAKEALSRRDKVLTRNPTYENQLARDAAWAETRACYGLLLEASARLRRPRLVTS